MRNRSSSVALLVAGLFTAGATLAGQGQGAPSAGRPVASAEKPWDPPRTPDGKPDIQGYWGQRSDITTYSIQAGEIDRAEHTRIGGQATQFGKPIVDPPDGRIPYQPWAAERAKLHHDQHLKPASVDLLDPVSRCFMEGVPRINYQGAMRIVQHPNQVVILHDYGHHYRVIPTDGRPHVPASLKLWMGDSRGRWEGNTLVVDVTNFNDKTWFDIVGSFHSDALHVTERWTFAAPDRIDYVATIEDPKVFTRPWKLSVTLGRNKPEEQWESAVCEGNRTVHVAFGIPF